MAAPKGMSQDALRKISGQLERFADEQEQNGHTDRADMLYDAHEKVRAIIRNVRSESRDTGNK